MNDTPQRQTRTFRSARVRYDPARAERQSRVTRLAIERWGSTDALAFLNTRHEALGASPIDAAATSAEACEQVALLIAAT